MNHQLERYMRKTARENRVMDEMREAGIKSQHCHATSMFFFGVLVGIGMNDNTYAFLLVLPFAAVATIINYKYSRRWKQHIDKASRVLKLHGDGSY